MYVVIIQEFIILFYVGKADKIHLFKSIKQPKTK